MTAGAGTPFLCSDLPHISFRVQQMWPVCVDPLIACMPRGRYRWDRVSHLNCRDVGALHSFARRLGLKRAWFQVSKGGMPHYDLNPARRAAAVALGALELDGHQMVAEIRWWRQQREGRGV